MRTGVSPGRARPSGVKGCVLSDPVPKRSNQVRLIHALLGALSGVKIVDGRIRASTESQPPPASAMDHRRLDVEIGWSRFSRNFVITGDVAMSRGAPAEITGAPEKSFQ